MARRKKVIDNQSAELDASIASNKWSRKRRIEFIDFRLCVDGKINRSDLVSFFGISIPQASLDLSFYRELVKNSQPPRQNLIYDVHQKVYLRSDDFRPVYPELCDSSMFFNDLYLKAKDELPPSKNFFGFIPDVGLACLMPPKRIISDSVLTNLLDAIRSHMALHVVYKSLSSDVNEDFLIAPHSFAFDGVRWHVRAYCYDRHGFRDYVLSRIVDSDAPKTNAPSDRFPDPLGNGFREVGTGNKDDADWNQLVTLKLTANPQLPEHVRLAIELDYGLDKGGVLEYQVKKALLFYAVRSMSLTSEYDNLPPERRQLVLVNKEEIESLLNRDPSEK
ncbi:MAG: WYL domain-containing protein [Succinivibrio sp.]